MKLFRKRENEALPGAGPIASAQPLIIDIQNVTKTYQMGEIFVHALGGISMQVEPGEYVAIVGASGSGKSTLMNVIGLLDNPSTGSYAIRGTEVGNLSKNQLADLRNREIGFVFQRFNLLARTTAQRQVELPLFYAGHATNKAKEMASNALARVGLADRAHHRPDELSGGQQQRVAIARALVNNPQLLLADEPTGALDTTTGQEVLALFEELHAQGLTVVVVTHDWNVAHRARRLITIRDGLIVSDRLVTESERNAAIENGGLEAHHGPVATPDAGTKQLETSVTSAPEELATAVQLPVPEVVHANGKPEHAVAAPVAIAQGENGHTESRDAA
jgi:putative ABC transport system ATP-binding protein